MTGLIEMMCLRAMMASARREESRRETRRKKAQGKVITCAVCRTYGGTMYRWGKGYICRDCKRKEKKK